VHTLGYLSRSLTFFDEVSYVSYLEQIKSVPPFNDVVDPYNRARKTQFIEVSANEFVGSSSQQLDHQIMRCVPDGPAIAAAASKIAVQEVLREETMEMCIGSLGATGFRGSGFC
jgi:hypothetical protein